MDDSTASEVIAAQAIADEYRRDGYEVSRDVALDFAPGLTADLLVRKNGETKVVDIKTRSSLAESPKSSKLAGLLRDKPGWSFHLLLVGEPPRLDSPEGVEPVCIEDALAGLDEAGRALDGGHGEAAFLIAWSACEALLRALVRHEGASEANVSVGDAVLGEAVYFGVMGNDDYERMTELRKYRDAIAHGFRLDGFSGELVVELITIARRVVAEQLLMDDED